MAAADAPKKISGVHKRCWRYIPNLTKSTESAPNLTKSPETVPKTEAQVSWCISISNRCCLPNHSYSDILVWLMPSDFKFFSIGIVIFGCCLFPNQLFLDVFDAFCNIPLHGKPDFRQCKQKYVCYKWKAWARWI